MEIGVEFPARSCERASVEMCPDRLHERLEADVLKVVVDDKSEVFVDGEDSNGIQVGQYLKLYRVVDPETDFGNIPLAGRKEIPYDLKAIYLG